MSEAETKAKDESKRGLYIAMAVSMWRLETEGDDAKDAAAKKEEFKAKRTEYIKKARRLARLLEGRGVALTLTQKAEEDA